MFAEQTGCRTRVIMLTVGLSGLLGMTGARVTAAESTAKSAPAVPSDNYDEMFERYLREARDGGRQPNGDSWSWMNGLALDRRARQVNDLVTIRVIESITASGSADSSLSKNSQASASVPGLFGLEKKLPGFVDPTALASTKSDTTFKGEIGRAHV